MCFHTIINSYRNFGDNYKLKTNTFANSTNFRNQNKRNYERMSNNKEIPLRSTNNYYPADPK